MGGFRGEGYLDWPWEGEPMRMRMLLFILLLLPAQSFAHQTHDWRDDIAAYLGAAVDTKTYTPPRSFAPETEYSIEAAEFRHKLEEFSGRRETVINGVPRRIPERESDGGRLLARQWLAREYEALGFTVSEHAFSGHVDGVNFIAEKKGTTGKVLILSSHLDSVGNAGANDDGSGTVAALLIAKALKDVNARHTLRVVAFDREETGLDGSWQYVRTLSRASVIGDIQLEMMAFNSRADGKFHVIDCDVDHSVFLTEAIMAEVARLGLPLTRVAACTDRSDHNSFWEAEIPAVAISENFFGGDGDYCYHSACDVVDSRLDFNYAAAIATAVANGVARLLQ